MNQLFLSGDVDSGSGILFGAQANTPQPTVIGGVVLVVALVIAVIVAWKNWEEAHEEVKSESPEEILSSLEDAHAAGEIDDQEMDRVRARLAGPGLGERGKNPEDPNPI